MIWGLDCKAWPTFSKLSTTLSLIFRRYGQIWKWKIGKCMNQKKGLSCYFSIRLLKRLSIFCYCFFKIFKEVHWFLISKDWRNTNLIKSTLNYDSLPLYSWIWLGFNFCNLDFTLFLADKPKTKLEQVLGVPHYTVVEGWECPKFTSKSC